MNARANARGETRLDHGFRLGTLHVDPRAGEVLGPGGREQLDPKVMSVLVFLAQRAGDVVLREDLISALWPNTAVTDDALNRCLYELRRQLSRAGASEEYRSMLETLPKRGYRLNAAVTSPSAPDPPSPARVSRRIWVALAGATAIAAAGALLVLGPAPAPAPGTAVTASIAVLPFIDLSAGQNQAYLADGIAEEVLNRLSLARNLRVIARTSSFSLRDKNLDIAEIGRKLNVSHVLEGSVRTSGDKVRITAQLIATSNSSHVWSDTVERDLRDLFAVQDEIANSVATALQVTLSPAIGESGSTSSLKALELFRRGTFFYYRREPGDVGYAIDYFEQAVNVDPAYAKAWAGLAGAYFLEAWKKDPPSPALVGREGEAARRAVELAPDLAMAQFRLSQYYTVIGDRKKAKDHLDKAIALDPGEPLVMSSAASDATSRGDLKSAIALLRRTVALDPLGPVWRVNLAETLLADGQLDEALQQYLKIREDTTGGGLRVELSIAHIRILQRRYDDAHAAIDQLSDPELRDVGQALLYAATGEVAKADSALRRLVTAHATPKDLEHEIYGSVRLAEVYAYRGMTDLAFQALLDEKASLERRRGRFDLTLSYLRNESRLSPFLEFLRTDPRWAAYIAEPVDPPDVSP